MNKNVVITLARKDEAARRLKSAHRTLRTLIVLAVAGLLVAGGSLFLAITWHGAFGVLTGTGLLASFTGTILAFTYADSELDKRQTRFFDEKLKYEIAVLDAAR